MKMTEVSGANRVGRTAKAASRRSPGDALFSLSASAEANSQNAAVGAARSVGDISALLALQEMSERDLARQALRQGNVALDILDELKADLLAGRIERRKLNRLRMLARQLREARVEPGLAETLSAIELRAEVELAKLAKYEDQESPS